MFMYTFFCIILALAIFASHEISTYLYLSQGPMNNHLSACSQHGISPLKSFVGTTWSRSDRNINRFTKEKCMLYAISGEDGTFSGSEIDDFDTPSMSDASNEEGEMQFSEEPTSEDNTNDIWSHEFDPRKSSFIPVARLLYYLFNPKPGQTDPPTELARRQITGGEEEVVEGDTDTVQDTDYIVVAKFNDNMFIGEDHTEAIDDKEQKHRIWTMISARSPDSKVKVIWERNLHRKENGEDWIVGRMMGFQGPNFNEVHKFAIQDPDRDRGLYKTFRLFKWKLNDDPSLLNAEEVVSVYIGIDKKQGVVSTRERERSRHLSYLKYSRMVVAAGPIFTGDADSNPFGSMILFNTEFESDANALFEDDPYTLSGVFNISASTVYSTSEVDCSRKYLHPDCLPSRDTKDVVGDTLVNMGLLDPKDQFMPEKKYRDSQFEEEPWYLKSIKLLAKIAHAQRVGIPLSQLDDSDLKKYVIDEGYGHLYNKKVKTLNKTVLSWIKNHASVLVDSDPLQGNSGVSDIVESQSFRDDLEILRTADE